MILLQMRAIIKAKGAPTTYFILANKPVHKLIMNKSEIQKCSYVWTTYHISVVRKQCHHITKEEEAVIG